ncbi:SDR family NAD(P)-dependent oxidoreductase [Pigmentiphaga daeguensis]|jgi:NAD(P)-dependent dehydrogenase (short-subunit alcohol dehydrogenase family)|uniref:SDR family NAD(P)-dependent oxidoreductase n=2 Tax=Alcaligenaceae TaxID=506 RepID=A0ABN1CFF1_9BURK
MDRYRVQGQLAVVTGGAHGIGLACAGLLREAGARVVIVDRDGPAARAAAQALGDGDARELDVQDAGGIGPVFASIRAHHGPIGILINNAGISIRKGALELELEMWRQVLDVNVTGAFLCAREAVRNMGAAGGCIVNTASIMGLSGGSLYPNAAYHTAKGAVVNMTRSLAIEWAPRRIRVNAVAPTWTRTSFIGELSADVRTRIDALTPLGRLAEPEDVAEAMLFLASPAASMITGHILPVDGGYLAQ